MEELLQHFSHKHPLIFTDSDEQNVDGVETICNGCTQKISGFAYSCKSCSFFLHKICAELPEKMSHPAHLPHSLTLLPGSLYRSSGFICNACMKFSKGFTYHCWLCQFDLDLCCVLRSRSIEHKSHKHPLILTDSDEQNVDGIETICNGCTQNISGFAYSCKSCSFFLHKICAELPEEMSHPLHPEHSLTLLPSPYRGFEFACNACEKPSKAFKYHCSLCEFNLDLCCALRSSIEHKSHKHPLFFTDSDEHNVDGVETICNGCTQKISGFAYSCKSCSFFLHKICAELPEEMSHPLHLEHSLTLFPRPPFYGRFEFRCNACGKVLEGFTYYCLLCEFYLDLCCALRCRSIEHKSHKHPLIFIDTVEQNIDGVETICDGCTQKISGFAYGCKSCSFFLHKICAELPEEMSHPLHLEHSLTLFPSPYRGFEFVCNACEKPSKAFTYHCSLCEFNLDLCCALRSSIEHKSHKHPLLFTDSDEQNVDGVETICNACTQKISGFAYSCKSCSFFLHKICAELPEEMSYPLHLKHSLTLLPRSPYYGSSEFICDACGKFSKGFIYHCLFCGYNLDLCCASRSSIETKSHEHPLFLTDSVEQNIDGVETICNGCTQKISRLAYSCESCSFFLHKICAELPEEMSHPLHLKHSLTLHPRSPYYGSSEFRCNACGKFSKGFRYHCSLCQFDLDLCCSLRSQSIEHESHEHPLSLVYSRASFKCHACCCTTHEGFSYMCNNCSFWIHYHCASLPLTIKNNSHAHFLDLAYSLPFIYTKMPTSSKCHICEEDVNRNCWIYHCEGCLFVIHVQCSMITRECKISIPVEDLDLTNSIHLPLPDELTSLIDQLVEHISLEDAKRSQAELNHFSHNHPLILFDIHIDNNLCSASGGELPLMNEKKESKVCDACVRPISTPTFYSCGACNFFLHKSCCLLPNKLKHPGHPHPMILQENSPEQGLIFWCHGCFRDCSGFVYKCVECRGYCLDVKCASLPSSIVHEVHEHPLFLKNNCITEGCAACPRRNEMFSFGCGTCNFSLHYQCALLPRTIKHRWDKHPFTLFYATIENGPDEYYCEFCEEEIHPNRGWFYHCIDCDQSACAYCIYQRDAFADIKWGTTHKFDSHPHLLTLVQHQPTIKSPSCDNCHEDWPTAFKCMQCNIMLHGQCASPFFRVF